MAQGDVDSYYQLLDGYHFMIGGKVGRGYQEPDWSYRREVLVREMDAVWNRLTREERRFVVDVYATGLYKRRLEVSFMRGAKLSARSTVTGDDQVL